MSRPPFWSDSFDMDLLKLFPQCAELFATVQQPLYVHGTETGGRLNHPSVWNASPGGLVAFFSIFPDCPAKPPQYWTREPIVKCTWEEAMRDAWPHSYVLTVDRKPVFDAFALRPQFETIMWHLRGWDKNHSQLRLEAATTKVTNALVDATLAFESIVEEASKAAYDEGQELPAH